MNEAFHNLGVEWPSLIAQGVNFAILLLVLWRFVYKPVLKMLDDRSAKISESMKNTQEIEEKLAKVSTECESLVDKAKKESDKIITESKVSAKEISDKIISDAEEKSKKIISEANASLEKEKEAIFDSVKGEVAQLVKISLTAILEKEGSSADDKLIKEAVANFSKEK